MSRHTHESVVLGQLTIGETQTRRGMEKRGTFDSADGKQQFEVEAEVDFLFLSKGGSPFFGGNYSKSTAVVDIWTQAGSIVTVQHVNSGTSWLTPGNLYQGAFFVRRGFPLFRR